MSQGKRRKVEFSKIHFFISALKGQDNSGMGAAHFPQMVSDPGQP
jgi:hypothetical protein